MNQPELGSKVSELRQLKGFTQEQLAEKCEVSTRTIQRIESGDVDPRSYTLHCLGEVLDFDFVEVNPSDENIWLALLHLSSSLCLLVVPLLLWSWKKNQSSRIDRQGRQVLNFQITMMMLLFSAGLTVLIVPGILVMLGSSGNLALEDTPFFIPVMICVPMPLVLIGLFCTYQAVVNTFRSLADKPVRYPLSIQFLK